MVYKTLSNEKRHNSKTSNYLEIWRIPQTRRNLENSKNSWGGLFFNYWTFMPSYLKISRIPIGISEIPNCLFVSN